MWQQSTVGQKRAILSGLFLGILLMVLVISASVYVTNTDKHKDSDVAIAGGLLSGGNLFANSTISVIDILTGKFSPQTFNGTWISGMK